MVEGPSETRGRRGSPSGEGGPPDLLFVVGCARSGTTWLQLLLTAHPAVATVKESHLFDHFVGPALRAWDALAGDPRELGLASVLSRDGFVAWQRRFALEIVDRIASSETRVVLDKTPDHALWIDALLTVFPEARILHLVRDPRDVVSSLLAAGEAWGAGWAPGNAYDAAWRWRRHVASARRAGEVTDAFRELRYEDLYAEPERELEALFRWLSLEDGPRVARAAVEDARIDRMREGETRAPWDLGSEPTGFVRRGGTGNWRDELRRREVAVVEYMCGELMRAYRYEPARTRSIPPIGFYLPWMRDQLLRRL